MARLLFRGVTLALAATAACSGGTSPGGGAGGRGGGGVGGGSLGIAGSGGSPGATGSGGDTGTGCPIVPAAPISPDVLILLDTSASMNDDPSNGPCDGGCGGSSRWAQTTAAIDAVVAQTAMTVNWGLALFADPGGGSCAVRDVPTQALAPNNASAIAAAISARTGAAGDLVVAGERPTRGGIAAAAGYLATLTDAGPKLILLLTAGAPDCNPASSDPKADDAAGAVAEITAALQSGFPTFVVGVATTSGPADPVLDQMAAAGGLPRSGSPSYYPVASTSELIDVLNTAIATAGTCLFALPLPPNNQVSDRIIVSVDGSSIPQDPAHLNGWDYAGGTRMAMELYGPPCDALMNQPAAHSVEVHFLCLIK